MTRKKITLWLILLMSLSLVPRVVLMAEMSSHDNTLAGRNSVREPGPEDAGADYIPEDAGADYTETENNNPDRDRSDSGDQEKEKKEGIENNPAKGDEAKEKDPPRLAVYYHEYSRRNLPSSPGNMDKEIHTIEADEVSPESELFLRDNTRVTIRITVEDFDPSGIRLSLYQIEYGTGENGIKAEESKLTGNETVGKGDECREAKSERKKDVTSKYYRKNRWRHERGNSWKIDLMFEEDGHYQMEISYEDPPGNRMEAALESQKNCFIGGSYYGPIVTLDKKDPVVESISTRAVPVKTADGAEGMIPCYEEDPTYEIVVVEENFHPGSFRWTGGNNPVSVSSWSAWYEDGVRKNKMSFCTTREGRYDLTCRITDGSGRKTQGKTGYRVDRSAPVLAISVDREADCHRYDYQGIQLFSRNPITFRLTAEDDVSEIVSIRYTFWNNEGKVTEVTRENKEKKSKYAVEITLDRKDFCGWITAECADSMGHLSNRKTGSTFLWESPEMSEASGSLDLSCPRAAYTDEKNHILYYRDTPKIRMDAKNTRAGIRDSYVKVVCGEEKEISRRDYHLESEIQYEIRQEMTLSAEQYESSSADNPVLIYGGYTDNAGYETKDKQAGYKLVIDKIAPALTVNFQDAGEKETENPDKTDGKTDKQSQEERRSGEKYFDKGRTAIITVHDRNFRPSATRWQISGKEGGYSIGEWHGHGKKHWCRVDFTEDGTYRLKLSVSDYSGNATAYDAGDSFTIDQTPPRLFLWMDQSKARHEKYYTEDVQLYILVKDENVPVSGIELYTGNGSAGKLTSSSVSVPGLQSYRNRGWKMYTHRLTGEGTYRISCCCQDLAGHQSGQVRLSSFVIDKTSPELEIKDLWEGITYTDRVTPKATVTDPHMDDSLCRAELYYYDGTRALNLEKYMLCETGKGGKKVFSWKDFPGDKKYDNRYVLRISACDLAGNRMTDREIHFYVDRWGTRFLLPEETLDFIKPYYRKQEKELSVIAYSMHPLQTRLSLTTDQEEFRTLGPEEYEEKSETVSGSDNGCPVLPQRTAGWYKTTYRIKKEVFFEEGDYHVSLLSREMSYETGRKTSHETNQNDSGSMYRTAGGTVVSESENQLWTEPLEFAIDKTPPSVVIGGLEEDSYARAQKEYTVTALDNARLKKLKVYIRKENNPETEETRLYSEKDLNEDHSITGILDSFAGYQVVGYEAWDYAGNQCSSRGQEGEKRVLVTKSPILRTYYTHKTETAILILTVMAAGIILCTLTRRGIFGIVKRP